MKNQFAQWSSVFASGYANFGSAMIFNIRERSI
jgi:hypothetical protein